MRLKKIAPRLMSFVFFKIRLCLTFFILCFSVPGLSTQLYSAAMAQGAPQKLITGNGDFLRDWVRGDLRSILLRHGLKGDLLQIKYEQAHRANQAQLICHPNKSFRFELRVWVQDPRELLSTTYYGLHRVGFYFPRPRMEVVPSVADMEKKCGQKPWIWRPRLSLRGFHLHTQHPSEWVSGFLGGEQEIALDFIRWLVHNNQNLLQLQLIRSQQIQWDKLRSVLEMAERFSITVGLSVSYTLQQQKSYKLIPFLASITGMGDQFFLHKNIAELIREIPFDILTVEIGSSEFSSTPFRSTLEWIESTQRQLENNGKRMFVKVHVSSNQQSEDFGNFNFLPQFASQSVGVLPHTVMFYGLKDLVAPMYGRNNFHAIYEFLKQQKKQRPVIYYPETSYFVGMDIDVPLLLTDYLLVRERDLEILEKEDIIGHLNFTTGQELGYWLMDWTVALLSFGDYRNSPMIALKLLGEDQGVWARILEFQNYFFKQRQLIRELSAQNLMDELRFLGQVHDRELLNNMTANNEDLRKRVAIMEEALSMLPPLNGVRNEELRSLLKVTWGRLKHAFYLRKAILTGRRHYFDLATQERLEALQIMDLVRTRYNRYPRSIVFTEGANMTSYAFGYAWPAITLHFWEREERILKENIHNPFFMNIYNPLRLIF